MNESPKKKKSLLRRILKWTGILLLLLLLFIIAAPFIFKDKIIAKVKEEANNNLNAKVDFGPFDLTVFSSFPNLTLTINDVSVANINEFAGDTLFSVKQLSATVDLMSVIGGSQYKVREVVLDKPRILARVLKDGKANWDITKASGDSAATTAPAEPSTFKMSLKNLEIKEGYIVYDDASMDMRTVLDKFNHTLSGDFTEDQFLLQTMSSMERFTFTYGGIDYINKAKTSIKADLDADMTAFKFTFKENEIVLNELMLGVDGWFAMPGNDMNMDIKFKAKQSEFKNFLSLVPAVYTKDFASVKTSGKLAFDGYVKGTYNDKLMPGFGTRILISDAMFQYPSLPKSANNIDIDVNIDNKTGDPDATVIDINKFHVEMAGNPVDIRMHVTTPVSDANIDGTVLGKVNLATVKDVVPLEKGDDLDGMITADIKMKGRMSSIDKGKYEEFNASGQLSVLDMNYKTKDTPYDMLISKMYLNFSPQFVELSAFDAKLGKSDIKAEGKIENFLQYFFKDELLKGRFSMSSGLMDLNQFMASEETPAGAPAAADTAAMSVIGVPGNIDFNLDAAISKLIYTNLEMNDVKGGVVIKDNKADLSNLKMNTLGGAMTVNGSYSTADIKKPKVDFKLSIAGFDIAQTSKTFITVQKLAPVSKYTQGRFSSDLSFTSDLDGKMMPVLNTLTGGGALQTKAVTVSGFEPLNKLADALKLDKFKRVDFSDLDIDFKFENGRVKVDPFDYKSGSLSGQMAGSTGFDQTIDYTMNLAIPRSEFGGQANAVLNNMVAQANSKGVDYKMGDKVNISALFGGTVTQPTVKTNLKDDAKNLVQNVTEQVKEQVVENVKEKASAEAEKILKDAEAAAAKVREEARVLSEKTKTEGYAAADKLEKEANNPVAKIAAKKAAEKLRKETDEKAAKIVSEADKKSNDIMAEARAKADKLK